MHELAAGELDVSGNPNLIPAPALNLMAVVTKGDSGTDVELSWDHTGWYTNNESTADPTVTHSYQYKCPACEDADWQGRSCHLYRR